jgi:hypothetical protein
MPYGYLGQNTPNQTVSNSGVFSISDVASLEKQGKFGGSLELIEEITTSGSQNYNFTSIQENKYDVHLLQINGYISPNGSQDFGLRFYESGVLETASVYQYAVQRMGVTGTFLEQKSTASNFIWCDSTGSENWQQYLYIYLYNLGNSSKYSFCTYQRSTRRNTTGGSYNDVGTYMSFGGGVLPQASLVNGIQIYNSATTSTGGTAKLYGVKQL